MLAGCILFRQKPSPAPVPWAPPAGELTDFIHEDLNKVLPRARDMRWVWGAAYVMWGYRCILVGRGRGGTGSAGGTGMLHRGGQDCHNNVATGGVHCSSRAYVCRIMMTVARDLLGSFE